MNGKYSSFTHGKSTSGQAPPPPPPLAWCGQPAHIAMSPCISLGPLWVTIPALEMSLLALQRSRLSLYVSAKTRALLGIAICSFQSRLQSLLPAAVSAFGPYIAVPMGPRSGRSPCRQAVRTPSLCRTSNLA